MSSIYNSPSYRDLILGVNTKVPLINGKSVIAINFDNAAIYVKNFTEAFNKLSNLLHDPLKKCVILTTDMEHHSNDLPWRDKFIIDYISVDVCGKLSMNDLEDKLYKYNNYTKLVTIVAKILSYEWVISVRSGCFCAQPYVVKLLDISNEFLSERIKNPVLYHPGMVRISFGLYNAYSEIDILVTALKSISARRSYYINK